MLNTKLKTQPMAIYMICARAQPLDSYDMLLTLSEFDSYDSNIPMVHNLELTALCTMCGSQARNK
jgi:hypothetical protein